MVALDSPGALVAYVQSRAPALGLDANAVLSVGAHEGINGGPLQAAAHDPAPGHPEAFAVGPWQLNSAGALARSPAAGLSPAAAQAWAWTTDGVDWALQQIAGVAHGLSGAPAVSAIVTKFEIPAEPLKEFNNAWNTYVSGIFGAQQSQPFDPGSGSNFGGSIGQIQMPGGPTPPGTPQTPGQANPGAFNTTSPFNPNFGPTLAHLLTSGALVMVGLVILFGGVWLLKG